MENRYGRYGITRRQRKIWRLILAGATSLGLVLVVIGLVAWRVRDTRTVTLGVLPLGVVIMLWAALQAFLALAGRPPES